VLEDRFLIRAHVTGVRRFRPPLGEVLGALLFHLWQRLTRRFGGFGTAKVTLGPPLSLREFLLGAPAEPAVALAIELMARVREAMPALPVPLVARHLLDGEAWAVPALEAAVREDLQSLGERRAELPGRGPAKIVEDALGLLEERGVIRREGATVRRKEDERDLFAYYAGSLAHLFET
jgi:glycerol-3-phosphate O-acyltransferase